MLIHRRKGVIENGTSSTSRTGAISSDPSGCSPRTSQHPGITISPAAGIPTHQNRTLVAPRNRQAASRTLADMKLIALPLLAVAVLAGCSAERTTPAAPASTVTVTAATPLPALPAPAPSVTPATVTVTAAPAPAPLSAPEAPGRCTDDDLAVTNAPLQSANTQRHVTVYFRNASSHSCTLFGYPGADLVTPAGGVLINVPRREANAAHHLTLNPGDAATADITAYAIDTSTGKDCARWGNLVVTPPNGFVSHPMPVDVPICNASISTVD